MRVKKIILWGGTVFSVALSLLALVYGGLSFFFYSEIATPPQLRSAFTLWVASFAGTFILSVIFLILMLREGELGR
jgi:hypothetical protein